VDRTHRTPLNGSAEIFVPKRQANFAQFSHATSPPLFHMAAAPVHYNERLQEEVYLTPSRGRAWPATGQWSQSLGPQSDLPSRVPSRTPSPVLCRYDEQLQERVYSTEVARDVAVQPWVILESFKLETQSWSLDEAATTATPGAVHEEVASCTSTTCTEALFTEVPTERPSCEGLCLEALIADVVSSEVPNTQVPNTEVPNTEAPNTKALNSDAPTSEAPNTDSPNTEVPNTEVRCVVSPEALEAHERGECRPCAYYLYKDDGCRWGDSCKFCHLDPPGEISRRKKEKRKLRKAAAQAAALV